MAEKGDKDRPRTVEEAWAGRDEGDPPRELTEAQRQRMRELREQRKAESVAARSGPAPRTPEEAWAGRDEGDPPRELTESQRRRQRELREQRKAESPTIRLKP